MQKKLRGKPRQAAKLAAKFSSSLIHTKAKTDDDHENNPFTFKNRNDAANNLSPIPVTRNLVFASFKGPDAIPRAAIYYAQRCDKLTKAETWHSFVVQDGSLHRVTIWFYGTQAVLVRERKIAPCTVERSIPYPSVTTARKRFDSERVHWSSPVPVDKLPAPPLPG